MTTPGRVRPPDPRLPAEYANRQSGQVEGLVTLWVRLPPRLLDKVSRVPHGRSLQTLYERTGTVGETQRA